MASKRRKRRLTRPQRLKRWYRQRFPLIVIALCLVAFAIVGGMLTVAYFPDSAVAIEQENAPG